MSTPTLSARAGLIQISLAGVLWGTGGLAVQVVRDVLPMSVLVISAWRMVIAAVVLVTVLILGRQLAGVVHLLRTRPASAALIGTATAAYQALYFAAVVNVGVSVATVVSLGLAPVLLTLGEAARDRRLPDPGHLVILGTALAGLLLVSGTAHSGDTGPHPVLGLLLAVASGTTYAIATALGRPLAQGAAPLALTTTTTTVGAIVLLPLAAISAWSGSPVLTADPVAAVTLVYLGVLTMALAYALLYAGLRTTTGSAAVVATLLEPVTAALVAAAFLDERLGVLGVIGTALILLAVAGLARKPSVPLG
jgi:DME family drug/metabolite transporter